jgi:hypothetical protein
MPKAASKSKSKAEFRFESVNIDSLFGVLDAVAFITPPTTRSISQFANIDPRTASKLLKNARLIGLVDSAGDDAYLLAQPYPFKGSVDRKKRVVREALLRSPILERIRQFMGLGDDLPNAMRKAMTVAGKLNYDPAAIAPLVKWAQQYDALSFEVRAERLVTEAVAAKETRHIEQSLKRVAGG